MKRGTTDLNEIAQGLIDVAAIIRAAADLVPLRPVKVQVYIEPDWIGAMSDDGGTSSTDVVDQLAALTGKTPGWVSSSGTMGTYAARLLGDGPWELQVSTYAKRPSEADLLKAERDQLQAELAELRKTAAVAPEVAADEAPSTSTSVGASAADSVPVVTGDGAAVTPDVWVSIRRRGIHYHGFHGLGTPGQYTACGRAARANGTLLPLAKATAFGAVPCPRCYGGAA